MKNKIFYLMLILLVAMLSTLFLFLIIKNRNEKKEKFKTVPSFNLYNLDRANIDNTIINNNSSLFIFFDPMCDSCIEEFEQINKNKYLFKKYNVFFVTNSQTDLVISFFKEINFEILPNMNILLDTEGDLMQKMDVNIIPSSYIYNKERVLVKYFEGPVKVELLIKLLSE